MDIGIIGLGLIGGSLSKAFSSQGKYNVYGQDFDTAIIDKAIRCKAIKGPLDDEMIGKCDVIIVALYPHDSVAYIKTIYDKIKPDAVIVDTCGVKKAVCDEIFPLAREKSFTFIGGHPMAGLEATGFDASIGSLFNDASMILVPDPEQNSKSRLEGLKQVFLDIGFTEIVVTTPEEHDKMIAYTSQLAHVVSSAYIKNPFARSYKGFSAGSFHDMTRVAKLNETMWTELFTTNKDYLTDDIDRLIIELSKYREAISTANDDDLKSLLRDGRILREELLKNNE